MYSILLAIIYAAFISLGLPDSLLGSAWPVMQSVIGVPMSFAGVITMIISVGTIVSSILSDRLTRKFGAGLVTAVSVFLTAAALFGFSASATALSLCFWAIPYGLGAGAVDAALNNYVALHYNARHMSWLHCFWGVGASVSPYIMSFCLTGGYGWQNGYKAVGGLQMILTVLLFVSLPLWTAQRKVQTHTEEAPAKLSLMQVIRLRGVKFVLLTFFGYCTFEVTAGLWASSYLVSYRGIPTEIAARFASLFYLGITFGRFLCGFVADKLGDRKMIRYGILTATLGVFLVALPWNAVSLGGLILTGLGCAPIYPSIIHATPTHFGKENTQAVIGIQMATAYIGSTFMPPFFGLLAERISVGLYPMFLMVFAGLMLVMSEWLNRINAQR